VVKARYPLSQYWCPRPKGLTTLDTEVVDTPARQRMGMGMGSVARPNSADLAERRQHYEALAGELAPVGIIASGSLAFRSHRRGKVNYACMANPPRLHGPYWHLTTKVAGKTVNRRLSESEASAYQEGITKDRRLRALLVELRTAARDVIELTLTEGSGPSSGQGLIES